MEILLGLLIRLMNTQDLIDKKHYSLFYKMYNILKFRGLLNTNEFLRVKSLLISYRDKFSYSDADLLLEYNRFSKTRHTKKSNNGAKANGRLYIENNYIVVESKNTPSIRNLCKSCMGSVWDNKNKVWKFPIGLPQPILQRFKDAGFTLDFKPVDERRKKISIDNIQGLKVEPFPYQKEGVEFINFRRGRCLIADEMGLGKTLQALAYIQYKKHQVVPALIVMPASLKLNWANEIEKFLTGFSFQVVTGTKDVLQDVDITLVNYEILHNYVDALKSKKYKLVVADEMHYVKTVSTKRTKAFLKIVDGVKKIIALTGTPISNRPSELFTILNVLAPELFKHRSKYIVRYCNAKKTRYGWDDSGSSNTDELNAILSSSFMIRRMKKDVQKQLPPKRRIYVPIEVDLDKYEKTRFAIMEQIKKEQKTAVQLVLLEKLKQLTVDMKLQPVIEWIENFLESGKKLVVFTMHTKLLDAIYEHFKNIAVKHNGQMSSKQKENSVKLFQTSDKYRLFIGNLQSAGTGITLTASADTCTLELSFVPSLHLQAEDRVHRIGQESDSVNAYYLLAHKTVEQGIFKSLCKKMEVISAVVDDKYEDIDFIKDILERMGQK